MSMPDTCGHVTELFKIFEFLSGPKKNVRKGKKTKNALLR